MGEIFDRELCSYGSKNLNFFLGKLSQKRFCKKPMKEIAWIHKDFTFLDLIVW